MSQLRANIIANFSGAGWTALVQLAAIPLYIHFMGIESYGLVGFYITLLAVLQILDFGLSPTMNREMARYSVQRGKEQEARDFVRTLEICYWVIGLAAGLLVAASSHLIATHWLKAGALSNQVVRQSLLLMGALATLQLPLSLYQGGLMGLQRQVLLNVIKIIMVTLGSWGGVLVLWLYSPTITAFLYWQIGISAVQVSLMMALLWRNLPEADLPPRFDSRLLRNVGNFAAGMSGITLCTLLLTQLDKVILSKLLSLEFFGYYMLATVLSNGLTLLTTPVYNAVFPRFSALVATADAAGLKDLYHRSTQLMATLILPFAAVMAFFSFDILIVWTRNAETARNASSILRLLVIGTAINGLMTIPFALQLANGMTKLGLWISGCLTIAVAPAIYLMASRYGAIGAAGVWAALNLLYMAVGLPLTHRFFLTGEGREWLLRDIGLPVVGAVLIAGVGRELIAIPSQPSAIGVMQIIVISFLTIAAAVLLSSHARKWVVELWTHWRTLNV
jgi:O-antigen/teichoic acid export membrane protein